MNGSLNEKLAVAQLPRACFYTAFILPILAGIGFLVNKKVYYKFPLFTLVRLGAGTEIAARNMRADRFDLQR